MSATSGPSSVDGDAENDVDDDDAEAQEDYEDFKTWLNTAAAAPATAPVAADDAPAPKEPRQPDCKVCKKATSVCILPGTDLNNPLAEQPFAFVKQRHQKVDAW